MPLVAGVDEAGRGPVLGPLVVAGVSVEDEAALAALGVKDSKKLSPAKRTTLALRIREVATRVSIRVVAPSDIDARMARMSLNQLEVEEYGAVLCDLVPPTVTDATCYVDACDTDAARFGVQVGAKVGAHARMVSAHKADDKYPVVSAASILAKVTRDTLVERLAEEYGCEVGSGYPSDPTTISFLEGYYKKNGALPPCARTSWETCKRLLGPRTQARTLLDFGGS
ncbi:MAG TPA: ribonuclease HII [Candidatus Thermoplasmatota archaeon]|nr:ribonuclease HII [Candidatus Thermoplasmatota archaeon]